MLFRDSVALCRAQALLTSLLLLISGTDALAVSTTTLTATQSGHKNGLQHGFVPITTRCGDVAELRRRQAQTALATCGFIDGDASMSGVQAGVALADRSQISQ